jgi:hypothetical protein
MTIRSIFTVVSSMTLGLALPSCTRTTEQEPDLGAETYSEDSTYAGSSSELGEGADNACAERACSITAECCSGYSCGYDPGRSHVQRYCLAE